MAQGAACAALGGSFNVVAVLARRGQRWPPRWQRWLLRWREPPCGAGRRDCCLGRRLQGRCHARSTQAALASTLARATLSREAARVLPRAAASRALPCSLDAGSAGSTLARATLWREAARVLRRAMALRSMPCSLDTGNAGFLCGREPPCGGRRVCCLGRRFQDRCCARSTQATLASTLAQATLWRGSTRLLLTAAAARSRPCSLDAGSAGF